MIKLPNPPDPKRNTHVAQVMTEYGVSETEAVFLLRRMERSYRDGYTQGRKDALANVRAALEVEE